MPHAIRIRLQTDIAEGLLSSEIGTTADESNRIAVNDKYSLPGSSFIAMSPRISSGNAPVAVFHPYPVKPLLLQGSLLPILPLMPHRTLRIQATEKTHGTVSEQLGTTEDESKFNIAFVPLGCCPPKLLLFTASLSAPLVNPHDSAPTKLAWPIMPQDMRINASTC